MKKRIAVIILSAGLVCSGNQSLVRAEEESVSLLENRYGISEITESGSLELNMDFSVSIPGENEIHVYGSAACDDVNQKKRMVLGLDEMGSNGVPYNSMDLGFYLDSEKLQAKCSEVSDKYLYEVNYGKDLSVQLLNSPILTEMERDLDRDRTDSFESGIQGLMPMLFWKPEGKEVQMNELISTIFQINKEEQIIPLIQDAKQNINLNGKVVTCTGYSFFADQLQMSQLIGAVLSENREEIPRDLIVHILYDAMDVVRGVSPETVEGSFGHMPTQSEMRERVDEVTDMVWEILSDREKAISAILEDGIDLVPFNHLEGEIYFTPENEIASLTFEATSSDTIDSNGNILIKILRMNVNPLNNEIMVLYREGINYLYYSGKTEEEGSSHIQDIELGVRTRNWGTNIILNSTIDTATDVMNGNGSISLNYDDPVPFTMYGYLEQEEKGEDLEIVLNELRLISPYGMGDIVISGSCGIGPLQGEVMELEGKILDLLTADMDSLMASVSNSELRESFGG